MKINFGPYVLSRRTDYSKIHMYNTYTNEDITNISEEIIKEMLDEYFMQKNNPDDFFEIKNNRIIGMKEAIKKIKYLYIPDGITEIERYAFADGCFSEVYFPDSLKIIKGFAFYRCQLLESALLPDSIDILEESIFKHCPKLKLVKLPNNITGIEKETFSYCSMLDNVVIPDKVKVIGDYAFSYCTSLENIKLSKNLDIIRSGAFKYCEKLKNIVFPDCITRIESYAFHRCLKLKDVSLPDFVYTLEKNVFDQCERLENIKLPNNLTTLSKRVFSSCYKLENIILPDNIKTLEAYVFYDTAGVKSINIPKNLYSIERCVFAESNVDTLIFNHDLEQIVMPYKHNGIYDLLTSSYITKLIISGNVKTITSDAFYINGDNINEIEYLGTKEQFKEFKNNNQELFKMLPNIKKVNFINNKKMTKEVNVDDMIK